MNLLLYLLPLTFILSQVKKDVYLYFDPESTEICALHKEQRGRMNPDLEYKRFEKIQQLNGDIDFYICREKFRYKPSKHVLTKVISKAEIEKVKFSEMDKLFKVLHADYTYLYPNTSFNKIYIFEKLRDGTFVRYEVDWVYYIE